MSKSLKFYRDDENNDCLDQNIENKLIINQSYSEETIMKASDFQKFTTKYKLMNIGDKLDSIKNIISYMISNEMNDIQHVKSFIKISFKELIQIVRENKIDYTIMQKYFDFLDLLKNYKSGEINLIIIEQEISFIDEKMKNFLLCQNKMKKKKKNLKIKQRLERRKEKLKEEIKENELKLKNENNLETISLD